MKWTQRLLSILTLGRYQRVSHGLEYDEIEEIGEREVGTGGTAAMHEQYAGTPTVDKVALPVGTLVKLAEDVAGVQSTDGDQMEREHLGPGIVEEALKDGTMRVHWTSAHAESWVEPDELRSLGPSARLIEVYKRDDEGKTRLLRRRVVSSAGLQHNWSVELLPKNLVRTVREDGHSWAFKYNWVFERIEVWWPQPPDDDDAEALCVAELAVL